MKRICLSIICILFVLTQLNGQSAPRCAIYWDGGEGAWEEGVKALENFLEWYGYHHERITPMGINQAINFDQYDIIIFPGGDADYYHRDISSRGIQTIQTFVNNGGSYLGICAGAEFACTELVWEGHSVDYPLDLVDAVAIGPIPEIAPWPDYDMTSIIWDKSYDLFQDDSQSILYYGGSYYEINDSRTIVVFGRYGNFHKKPAVIASQFGEGRVLLISPHPEIEENSTRDGVPIAAELVDPQSDWPILQTFMEWLHFKEMQ